MSDLEKMNDVISAAEPMTMDVAKAKAEEILQRIAAGDAGAPFEPESIGVFTVIKRDAAEWARVRDKLKGGKVGVTALEREMRGPDTSSDESLADRLVAMARDCCTFVHDPDGEPYAIFDVDGARNVLHVESKAFADFLGHAFYKATDRAPTEAAQRTALSTLRGQARFEGEQCEIHVRIAFHQGAYWLDLADDQWRCVRIDARGWRILSGADTPLFTRSASMRPLPTPERGGDLASLWPLVNVPESHQLLTLTWLLECLRPETPHVVLELTGEQGSAKSSTQAVLKQLIDPNQANLRAAPKSAEDVWIQARNTHVVSLENLSHLSAVYQDALCVLATGGGYSTRTLYTNAEETILNLKKPVVLNGIAVVVTAQDLLDRSIHVDLPTISDRLTGGDLDARFALQHGKLVGGVLDLFVKVLAELRRVQIGSRDLPRMADFAMLGEAVYRVNGKKPGDFLNHYRAMRSDGVQRTIDASPVGAAILAFLERTPGGFEGTVGQLLERLEHHKPHGEAWPRSAKGLADALRRLAPGLRQIGISAAIGERSKFGYLTTLKRSPVLFSATGQHTDVHQVHQVHQDGGALGERDAHGLAGHTPENISDSEVEI